MMRSLGEELSDADLAYMMEVADLDRDGMIDMDEFRHLMLLASASAAISPTNIAAVARNTTLAAVSLPSSSQKSHSSHQNNHSQTNTSSQQGPSSSSNTNTTNDR